VTKAKSPLLFVLLAVGLMQGQVTTFEGIDASQLNQNEPKADVDPNGAIGTQQYMEWVNVAFQAWDKTTSQPVWSEPVSANSVWTNNGLNQCGNITGDGEIIFDRLASRWVIAAHSNQETGDNYFYCVAVSNTDNLASTNPPLRWYTYAFSLTNALGENSEGMTYFPDWPKIATWPNAYYIGIDVLDPVTYDFAGVLACALDRTNMLNNDSARPMQCIEVTGADSYGYHSLEPADVEGTTAPPAGQDEMYVSIQNPPEDGHSVTSNQINVWDFQLDPNWSGNSKLVQSQITVPTYKPGCYNVTKPLDTVCVPQPATHSNGNHFLIDSVGDRLMSRLSYRNFGSYQSFLVSHTIAMSTGNSKLTGIRWYELRGSGVPTLYQSGTLNLNAQNPLANATVFRFMPSITQDQAGNAAVGYSVSGDLFHPGIRGASWNLTNDTTPMEFNIQTGGGDQENSVKWGSYTSMTVDPVNNCTFWYVNQYLTADQTGTEIVWQTRIGNFQVSGCSDSKIGPSKHRHGPETLRIP
jgi:hypothetical protein